MGGEWRAFFFLMQCMRLLMSRVVRVGGERAAGGSYYKLNYF